MTVGELKSLLNKYDDTLLVNLEMRGWFEGEHVEVYSEQLFVVEEENKYKENEICIMNEYAFEESFEIKDR